MTSMFEAMNALFIAMEDDDSPFTLRLDVGMSSAGMYHIDAVALHAEDGRTHALCSAEDATVEGATAQILEQYKEKFEEFRASKVAGLNKILEAHSGVIKGARSKIKR